MILLDNAARARRVRLVLVGSALWCLAMAAWAAHTAQAFGLAPGDGGVLRPAIERLQVAAILALLGVAPLAAMIVYARGYLLRIERFGHEVDLTVADLFGARTTRVPIAAIRRVTHHEGHLDAGGVVVHAPWLTVFLRGRRLPYIVDLQARRVDAAAIARLAAAREPNRPGPAPGSGNRSLWPDHRPTLPGTQRRRPRK